MHQEIRTLDVDFALFAFGNMLNIWGLKLPLQSEGTCALYKPGFPAFFVVAKWCCDLSNCNGASTL